MDQTLTLLVEDEPQRQARKLLDHVATRCRAKAAAVVTVSADELASFAGEVPLSLLATLQSIWRLEGKDLRAGRPVNGGDHNVLPLMDGRDLVGLLFMDGGTRVEVKNAAVLALAAALKVARERPARRVLDPETAVGSEIERRRLLAALERHEWNIARVARLIGVTRRTVYLRLKRYNIDRQRVPKTLKPCPPLERA